MCDIAQDSCGEVPVVYFATEAGNLTKLQIFISEAFFPLTHEMAIVLLKGLWLV